MHVKDVVGEAEDVRVFADVQKKRSTLQLEGISCGDTLCELMRLPGEFISRCGVPPYHGGLTADHVNGIAAHTAEAPDACGERQTDAALLPPRKHTPYARNLLLLAPTGKEPFAQEIARFAQRFNNGDVELLAAPRGEGVLPHLLALDLGLMLDTLPLPCHAPEADPSSLLRVGKGCLLLLATDGAMPYLLSCGLPLTPFGFTQPGDRILIRHGGEITVSLSRTLLSRLNAPHTVTISLPARAPAHNAPTVTVRDDRICGRVTARGGCEQALLALIGAVRAQGGDPHRTTLTAVLEAPPEDVRREAASELMLSVLDHHRVCAELAIPTVGHRLSVTDEATPPVITLFAVAEKGAAPCESFVTRWQAACAARDFGALRALLYSAS